MQQNQVAQAVQQATGSTSAPAGITLPDGSTVQGMHVDADALADIFVTGDAKTVETTRVERFARFIENAPEKELDDALRGPTADEKKAGEKLPPFVRKAIAKGMQESSARARLTEMRKIRDAVTSGLKIDTDKGWFGVFEQAKQTLEARNTARKADAMAQDWGESLAKARSQMGIPLVDEKGQPVRMTAEQLAAQEELALKLHDAKHSRATEMARAKALIDEADRYLEGSSEFAKEYGAQFAYDLALKLLDRLGFDVVAEKRKTEPAPAPAGTVQTPAQDTAQGSQQPAAQQQAA